MDYGVGAFEVLGVGGGVENVAWKGTELVLWVMGGCWRRRGGGCNVPFCHDTFSDHSGAVGDEETDCQCGVPERLRKFGLDTV